MAGLLVGLAVSVTAPAGEPAQDPRYALCPPDPALPIAPAFTAERDPGTAEVTADRVWATEDGRSVFVGGVEVVRDRQALSADRVSYDRDRNLIEAHGDLRLWDPAIFWRGRYGRIELDRDLGRLEDGEYRLLARRGRGKARVAKLYTKEDLSRLRDVDYTTCSGEVADWKLSAKRIKIDHEEEWGSAQNVILKVRDVPVFYLPYISFPVSDKRKSGFLPPTIGSSSDTGFDLTVPYYWNIAPERDATFAPRVLSDRGVMLGGQYRYLMRRGGGQLDAEYLPSDSQFDDDDRYLIGFTHDQRFAQNRGRVNLNYNRVSDAEYFEDFGSSLALASTRFLEQRADLSYRGDRYSVLGRLFGYQTVDPSVRGENRPYDRLPQLVFRAFLPRRNQAVNLEFRGEATYFDRDAGPIGGRLDLRPVLSFPIYSRAGFLVPKLSLSHTQYLLENTEGDDSPQRTLPIVSADGGVVLERELALGGSSFLQTLEPRAFYLYIPETNQDDIPIFDTGEYDLSYTQLFRENRFSGPDRIGDANQVTLALTSRLLDRGSSWEHLRARIGQTFYFKDREVVLPPRGERDDDPVSELVGELGARFRNGLSARASLIWDPNDAEVEKGVIGVRYHPDPQTIVNAEYRIRQEIRGLEQQGVLGRTEVDQTDLSLRWPLNPSWAVLARWNYSLDTRETLEAVGGVEYESCCWGVRLVGRRFLSTFSGEFDNAFYVQLELKGLAGFGRRTVSFLKKSIPGYEQEF